MKGDKNIQSQIAHILLRIGSKACVEKAELLLGKENSSSSLNLRSLGLKGDEVSQLAKVLKGFETAENCTIDSISFSYNNQLYDQGASILINSLPNSIRELGLVNCGMGESSGKELLKWIQNAPNLTMICAEGNSFSSKLKAAFRDFSSENSNVLVVI